MKADISQVELGPLEAQEILNNVFDGQRHVTEGHVNRIAAEMVAGNWRLSPDMLVLIKGKLANGQHRLLGLVRAKKKLPFLLLKSNDEELYKILDCGRSRSVGDVIGGQYANHVASVARLVVLYDLDAIYSTGGGGGRMEKLCTRSMQIEFAEENRGKILPHVSYCHTLYSKFHIVQPNVAATVSFIATRDTGEEQRVRQFITNVYDGESVDDAAKLFRERMIRDRTGTSRPHRHYVMALMIKSLRSYLNGTKPAVLKLSEGEPFPRL